RAATVPVVKARGKGAPRPQGRAVPVASPPASAATMALTSLPLALSGFGALGAEILWFRHFTLLLGGFRAVFSLLLTVILLGMGVGSLVGGVLVRPLQRT